SHALGGELLGDAGADVEAGGALGRGGVRGGNGGGDFVPHPRGHLVAAAACGRADRGGRPRGVGAVLAHRLDQGGDDPGGGPGAARVGGADDPGGGVGEQD